MHGWKHWLALGCTLTLMVIIFILSSQPGPESISLSNAALAAAEKTGANAFIPAFFSTRAYANIRKWAHFYLYAAFGLSMAMTVYLWSRRFLPIKMAMAALFCLLYAVSDEIHQYFVPERAGMWQDVIVDAFGFLLGIAAVWLFLHWRAKHGPNRK